MRGKTIRDNKGRRRWQENPNCFYRIEVILALGNDNTVTVNLNYVAFLWFHRFYFKNHAFSFQQSRLEIPLSMKIFSCFGKEKNKIWIPNVAQQHYVEYSTSIIFNSEYFFLFFQYHKRFVRKWLKTKLSFWIILNDARRNDTLHCIFTNFNRDLISDGLERSTVL